jgi:hypothetical protein
MAELRYARSSRISEPSLVINGGTSFRFFAPFPSLNHLARHRPGFALYFANAPSHPNNYTLQKSDTTSFVEWCNFVEALWIHTNHTRIGDRLHGSIIARRGKSATYRIGQAVFKKGFACSSNNPWGGGEVNVSPLSEMPTPFYWSGGEATPPLVKWISSNSIFEIGPVVLKISKNWLTAVRSTSGPNADIGMSTTCQLPSRTNP